MSHDLSATNTVYIAEKFEQTYPDMAKKFRRLGISIYMPIKPGTKRVPKNVNPVGIPFYWAGYDSTDWQLTFSYKKDESRFTEDDFKSRCEKLLREARKGQRELAKLSLRQRYEDICSELKAGFRLSDKQMSDLRGHGSMEYFQSYAHKGGDTGGCFMRWEEPQSCAIRLHKVGKFSFATSRMNGLPKFSWEGLEAEFTKFEADLSQRHSKTNAEERA